MKTFDRFDVSPSEGGAPAASSAWDKLQANYRAKLGAFGSLRQTPGQVFGKTYPKALDDLLAHPRWKGAEVVEVKQEAIALWVWGPLTFVSGGRVSGQAAHGCSPGFVRTVHVIRHPSGAEVRWFGPLKREESVSND